MSLEDLTLNVLLLTMSLSGQLCQTIQSPDSALCVVKCLKQYLKKEKVGIILRISCGLNCYVNVKPFKPVHKDSVSRWINVFSFKIRYKCICLRSTLLVLHLHVYANNTSLYTIIKAA